MELRHLRYFVAVAEEENVTRAAERLHLSQPSLSRQIRDLELELGVSLFERSGKAVKLTRMGLKFLDEARAILQRVDEAVEAVRAEAHGALSELHVGYAPSPTVEILPLTLRAFQEEAPKVRVLLHDMTSEEMVTGLREGTLQVALMVRQSATAARGLHFESLRDYRMGVVAPPGHPFSKKSGLSLAEIAAESLVVYARESYPDYHEALHQLFGAASRKLRIAEECDGALSMIAAVEAGRGVAVVAECFSCIAGLRIPFVPIVPPVAPLDVGMMHRSGATEPLTRRFLEITRKVATGLASR